MIAELAHSLGLQPDEVLAYGPSAAKIELSAIDRLAGRPDGRIVSVTSMTPTRFGEGKTTTSISLTQGLGAIGEKPVLCLREPSLGPGLRPEGRRHRRRPRPGGADGGDQPPLHRRHPRDRGRQQPARGDGRLAPPAGKRPRARPALDHLAPLRRHGRPRAPPDGRRPRGPRERRPARDRLRHHGRIGGDGDRRSRTRSRRPSRPARRDHSRLDLRGRARDRRADRGRGLDGGAAQAGAEAEPRPDARGPAGAPPLRARSPTSRTATTRSSPTGSASSSATGS